MIKPEWNENRELILKNRYLYKNEKTWKDLCERINNSVKVDIYNELLNFDFIPAGRMLSGLGTNTTKTFFNCYVIDFENVGDGKDSRSAIMDLKKRAVEISARGGGLGINWSSLRPRNSKVNKVNGISSGTVSWMHTLDADIGQVTQGGSRRGAMMFGLEPWHPDIFEFITVKEKLDKLNNANLSVFVSDNFMNAVKNNLDWNLEFPDTNFDKYDMEWNGDLNEWKNKNYPIIVYKTVKAIDIYNLICKMAHQNGEPGIVFLERYNKLNITKDYERLICTNPCGEIGLPADGVCNLGSINLVNMIKDENIQWEKLQRVIWKSVEFLDEIIDINPYYQQSTKEHQQKFRKIGLSLMGIADMFILLKIKYGSQESIEFIDKLMKFIQNHSFCASALLALEKGCAPIWKKEMIKNDYIQQLDNYIIEMIEKYGLRNTRILTFAPTGCLIPSTKIKTDRGNLTIEEIFNLSNIELKNIKNNQWYIPLEEINVFDINNNKNRILKLYSNGESETILIKTENGKKIEGTKNHKVLIKVSKNKAKWIELNKLKKGDKILIKNNI